MTFFYTSKLNGMKNLAIINRVLQRDRVLQRLVLERYYCSCCRGVHLSHHRDLTHELNLKSSLGSTFVVQVVG